MFWYVSDALLKSLKSSSLNNAIAFSKSFTAYSYCSSTDTYSSCKYCLNFSTLIDSPLWYLKISFAAEESASIRFSASSLNLSLNASCSVSDSFCVLYSYNPTISVE